MEEVKKPKLQPTGWHLKHKHVDENGDVYNKGKYTGENVSTEIMLKREGVENIDNIIDTSVNKTPVEETPKQDNPIEKIKKEPLVKEATRDLTSLQTQLQQQQELINKLLLNQSPNLSPDKRGYTQTKDIPKEDYQEKKEVFITRGRGTILSCYEKDGKWYYPPYGMPPVFEYYYTDMNRKGKDADILHFSIFSTHSKKEIEYIKESPFFNMSIFNEVEKAVKYSSEMYEKMQNLTSWASRLEGDKLFNQAIGMGINIKGKGKEEIKLEIVGARLAQLQSDERKVQETRVARLSETAIFETPAK